MPEAAGSPGAGSPAAGAAARPLRSDARHNRARILAAARDVFVEQGPGAPLEEVSRRAGTGIATLYRRFPDRRALIRAVVLGALQENAEEARRAVEADADPFGRLTRYMHRALDSRIAAVIPALLGQIPFDDQDVQQARDDSARHVQELIDAAHRAGSLRPDVTFGDIGLLIVRLSQPLPGSFARNLNDQLGHRHLDLLIAGLRPTAESGAVLTGPAMTLEDLQSMDAAGN